MPTRKAWMPNWSRQETKTKLLTPSLFFEEASKPGQGIKMIEQQNEVKKQALRQAPKNHHTSRETLQCSFVLSQAAKPGSRNEERAVLPSGRHGLPAFNVLNHGVKQN